MKKYILVQEKVMEEMVDHVNERIKDGYSPVGGISVSMVPHGLSEAKQYTQAMMIEENGND